MSDQESTVECAAPPTVPAAGITDEWLEQLQAHIEEGGRIGEPAARDLFREVLMQRERIQNLTKRAEQAESDCKNLRHFLDHAGTG